MLRPVRQRDALPHMLVRSGTKHCVVRERIALCVLCIWWSAPSRMTPATVSHASASCSECNVRALACLARACVEILPAFAARIALAMPRTATPSSLAANDVDGAQVAHASHRAFARTHLQAGWAPSPSDARFFFLSCGVIVMDLSLAEKNTTFTRALGSRSIFMHSFASARHSMTIALHDAVKISALHGKNTAERFTPERVDLPYFALAGSTREPILENGRHLRGAALRHIPWKDARAVTCFPPCCHL